MDAPATPATPEIVTLATGDIDRDLGGRIGMFWPLKAEALAALIGVDGQHEAIKVARNPGKNAKIVPYVLVAGLHRLAACAQLGIGVQAIIVEGDADALRAMQASENMHRRSLDPVERACFVHALAEAAQASLAARHGDDNAKRIAAMARWEGDLDHAPAMIAGAYSWQPHVQAAMGLSERMIRNDLALYRAVIAPDKALATMLAQRDNPLSAGEFAKLVKVRDDRRSEVMRTLIDHPGMDVEQAMVSLGMVTRIPKSDFDKHFDNFLANFDRCRGPRRKTSFAILATSMTPGERVVMRDALDEADQAKTGGKQ